MVTRCSSVLEMRVLPPILVERRLLLVRGHGVVLSMEHEAARRLLQGGQLLLLVPHVLVVGAARGRRALLVEIVGGSVARNGSATGKRR